MPAGDGADHPISSEAWSQARARRRDVWQMAGVDPAGLCGPGVRHVELLLQIVPATIRPPWQPGSSWSARCGRNDGDLGPIL